MANELRRRQLAIGGLIEDNPLNAGDLAYNSVALAAVAGGVSATEYLPVVFDPDGIDGAPEVAYVTALTAGAGVATIVRGREGSTPREHAQGTTWIHAITPCDVPQSVDTPWGGDLGFDYEFEADTTSVPAGWAWVNQGAATYEERFGAGKISKAAEGGVHLRGIMQSLGGAPGTWTATAKISTTSGAAVVDATHLWLRQSSNAHGYGIRVYNGFNADLVTTDDDDWASPGSSDIVDFGKTPQYLRIVKHSASSWDFLASHDGIAWMSIRMAQDISAHITPDQIGVMQYAQDRTQETAIHWFRLR